MPTFKITDPNTGRTVQLTGDSPPTQQEIEQVFSQFDVQEVDPIVEQRKQLLSKLNQDQSALDAFLIGAGRGITTLGRGLGIVEDEDPIVSQAFADLKEQRPISTFTGEIAGESAPFLVPGIGVGGIASIPARVLATGLLGATEAGIISEGLGADEDQTLQSAGIGGAIAGGLELGLPYVGRALGKAFRKLTGKTPTSPLMSANGSPTPEFIEAIERSGLTIDDALADANRLIKGDTVENAVQQSRKEFLESQGITPTKAQVTGDPNAFQAQTELAGQTGVVNKALKQQEKILEGKFENAITATGGSANQSNSTAFDFVADRSIDLDSKITEAYKAAREFAPTDKIVKPIKLIDGIKSIAGSDSATGGLASATRDILKAKGVLTGKGLKNPNLIDATTAEGVRIDLNALHNSLTPFGKSKLRDMKNALDFDVEKAVGVDIFKGARASKAKFESDLNRAKVNKFDKRNKNLVRDILENKVNPDNFLKDAILSKTVRSADVEQLKRYLITDNSDAGVAAWNDVRAETMQHIRKLAVKEVAGEPALSRAGIEKALDSLGRDKLRVLFSGDERKFLNDMLKVSKLREPVRGTQPSPSGAAIRELAKSVNKLPVVNLVLGDLVGHLSKKTTERQVIKSAVKKPIRPLGISQAAPALGVAASTQQQEQ